MIPGCFVVLLIVLLFLILIALNPVGFILNCGGKSKSKSIYEILKIHCGRRFFLKLETHMCFIYFLAILETNPPLQQ